MSGEVGRRVGDYEILAVLGAGGMGRVYKVRNVISDRVEAMKVLLPDLGGHQELANRFRREIKILAALNHPHIAALQTALTLDNQFVMIMEYVEGNTLAACLERGPIPAREALDYIDQVLDALSYAHGQRVIHRDIKPSNMMLTPQGIVKLMDFGIARSGRDPSLTTAGTTMGSLYYMSPEQVRGEVVDQRSDLYSVGVSLYEMVTGQRPFQFDSDVAIMAAHLQQMPKPPIELRPGLPKALSDIIMTAMAKNPAQRFQSADAFRAALKTVGNIEVFATPGAQEVQTASTSPVESTLSSSYCFPGAVDATSVATAQSPTAPPPTQPLPSVLALSPPQGRHRGLYMSLGALIVGAVLLAAGLYSPRRNRVSAEGKAASAVTTKTSDAPLASIDANAATGSTNNTPKNSASSSALPGAGATTLPAANPSIPRKTESFVRDRSGIDSNALRTDKSSAVSLPHSRKGDVVRAGDKDRLSVSSDREGISGTNQDSPPVPSVGDPQGQPNNSEEFEQIERQMDQLASRAASVKDSLENLRRQQAAQGLGLRGDVASTQERMDTYMGKAQAAMRKEDIRGSKKYMDLAEPEIEKLERFLGR